MPRPPINRRITPRPSHKHWSEDMEQKAPKLPGRVDTESVKRAGERAEKKIKYQKFVDEEKRREARKTV